MNENIVYDADGIALYNNDADDVLPWLAATIGPTVDLILTDPPYNVSSRHGRGNSPVGQVKRADGTTREIRRDFGEWDYAWNPEPFFEAARQLLKPGGSLVAFTSEWLIPHYMQSGLTHRGMTFWHKSNPAPNFRRLYSRSVEMAVWQTNGDSWTFNGGGYVPNIFKAPVASGFRTVNTGEKRRHPTQKAEAIVKHLMEIHAAPGGLILDPYAGSGTTLRVAKDLGHPAIGIEINPEYCELAVDRLKVEARCQERMPI